MKNDDSLSAKIVSVMVAAGGSGERCPTCCNPKHAPFRRYDANGRVIHGCIDAVHAGTFTFGSESARWHHRPEAARLRRDTARSLGLVR